ncbi:hypothetical protein LINPERHAP1_LOCUS15562 [Linum perenne]
MFKKGTCDTNKWIESKRCVVKEFEPFGRMNRWKGVSSGRTKWSNGFSKGSSTLLRYRKFSTGSNTLVEYRQFSKGLSTLVRYRLPSSTQLLPCWFPLFFCSF